MVERAREGRLQVALVEGEAGIGKTRLVDDISKAVGDGDVEVCRAAGHELERSRPFGLLVDALGLSSASTDGDRAEIARLILAEPTGQAGGAEMAVAQLRFLIVERVLDLVERLASEHPVLLALEDLHWADPSTLLVLTRILRRVRYLPLTVLVSCRPLPRSPELQVLIDQLESDGHPRFPLAPLPPGAVAELVRALLDVEPGATLVTRVAAAGGNPLFIGELVAALTELGEIDVIGGAAEVSGSDLPPSLRLTILRRLRALSNVELDLLGQASILGSSFSLAHLAAVVGRPAGELAPLLEGPMRAGFISGSSGELSFRHDLVRDAIYSDIPPAVRKGLHAEAGRRLATANAAADEVAAHLVLGASPGDLEAVFWLRRAAREAAPRSPSLAADLLGQALRIAGDGYPEHDSVVSELIQTSIWADRPGEAEKLALEVLGRPHDPSVDTSVKVGLLRALYAQARNHDYVRLSGSLVNAPSVADRDRARVLGEIAFGLVMFSWQHQHEGAQAGIEAIRLGEMSGDDLSVTLGLWGLSLRRYGEGHAAMAVDLAGRALRIATASRDPEVTKHLHYDLLALYLLSADRLDDAEEALQTGLCNAERLGATWNVVTYYLILGQLRLYSGSWDEARVDFQTALSLAAEVGTRLGLVWNHSFQAQLALHRGDLDAADEHARTSAAVASARDPEAPDAIPMWAQALVSEAKGDLDAAHSYAQMIWRSLASWDVWWLYQDAGFDLARIALAADDRALATAIVEATEELARRNAAPTAVGQARRARAMLEDDADLFVEAVAAYRRGPRPFALAQACEDAGAALARIGNPGEGRLLLEEAIEGYERVGAARDISRAEASLRSLGVRRGRRGPRRRPTIGWDALTDTEQKVAALVAEGLSNPEVAGRLYISRRTVETHMGHIFGKLTLSSRSELREAVRLRASAQRR